jgi:bacteriorhodopsin
MRKVGAMICIDSPLLLFLVAWMAVLAFVVHLDRRIETLTATDEPAASSRINSTAIRNAATVLIIALSMLAALNQSVRRYYMDALTLVGFIFLLWVRVTDRASTTQQYGPPIALKYGETRVRMVLVWYAPFTVRPSDPAPKLNGD